MGLVELVGPPAAGKSALVAACLRGEVHDVEDGRRSILVPRHPSVAPLAGWARTVRPGRPLRLRIADRLLRAPDEATAEAALTAVEAAWGPFLELVAHSAPAEQTPGGPALRLMERSWLLDALRGRALLETSRAAPAMLLLDEGLTHPLKVSAAVDVTEPSLLRRYSETVPLPDVLVVLDGAPDVLDARLRERARTAPHRARSAVYRDPQGLRSLIERCRDITGSIAEVAAARGVRVIRLDGSSAPPGVLAEELLASLRTARTDSAGARR